MIEVTGNLWTYPADFRVITTNGTVRKDGCAVLGRGCAQQATKRYPKLARLLGERLRAHGGPRVEFFEDTLIGDRFGLFAFPVKHQWYEFADLDLIAASVEQFQAQLLASARYVMPRPGCGNGGLQWHEVRPIVAGLPDNVFIIDFGPR